MIDLERIVRAGLQDVVEPRLAKVEARLQAARLDRREPSSRWRRALARFVVGTGRQDHDLEATAELVAALRRLVEWQQARATHLEARLERLGRARDPGAWAGVRDRPVVLVGLGGGGTRVLAEAALRLGVLLGNTVNESYDSVEWAPLLYRLALQGGGRPEVGEARDELRATAERIYGRSAAEGEPWGWKLPETVLVLPHVLDAFPRARVVLLVRHPVPSALRRPHLTARWEHPLGRRVLWAAYRAAGLDPERAPSDPDHLRSALAWRYQVGCAVDLLDAEMPSDRLLRLRFEDFALDPVATERRLAAFLGAGPGLPGSPFAVDDRRLRVPERPAAAATVMELCGDLAGRVGYPAGWLEAPCELPQRRVLLAAADVTAAGRRR